MADLKAVDDALQHGLFHTARVQVSNPSNQIDASITQQTVQQSFRQMQQHCHSCSFSLHQVATIKTRGLVKIASAVGKAADMVIGGYLSMLNITNITKYILEAFANMEKKSLDE